MAGNERPLRRSRGSIASARERLYLTNPYFAPDDNFLALLLRAARRGVDVRILVGGPSTDVALARAAAHGRYETLLEAGARVFGRGVCRGPPVIQRDQPRGVPAPPSGTIA